MPVGLTARHPRAIRYLTDTVIWHPHGLASVLRFPPGLPPPHPVHLPALSSQESHLGLVDRLLRFCWIWAIRLGLKVHAAVGLPELFFHVFEFLEFCEFAAGIVRAPQAAIHHG